MLRFARTSAARLHKYIDPEWILRLIVSVRSLCAAIHPKILQKLRRGHVFFDHRRSSDPGDTNARRRVSPADISDPQG